MRNITLWGKIPPFFFKEKEKVKKMRESFVFYKSFMESVEKIPQIKYRYLLLESIIKLGLFCEESDEQLTTFTQEIEQKLSKNYTVSAIFSSIKPQIISNLKKYLNGLKGRSSGHLGGAPQGNKNASKNNPKTTPNDNVNDNVNDLSNCLLSPLDESAHEKNATERRNKKEVTEDKAEQNKGLQGVTPIRTQKVDPYYSEEVKRFKSCYKAHFGAIPFLSSPQCLQLSELIEQTPDFFETLDDVLKTLKSIGEFTGKDGKKYKPSVSFLLKDKNYSDLRNGVYDNRAAPDEDFYNTTFMAALREVREQE